MNNDIVEALKQLIEMILTESEKLSEDFEKHDFADVEKSYIITNKLNILTETLNDFKNAHTNEDLLKAATKTKEKLLKRDISKSCGREIMKQHARDAGHEVS